jgi:hypothetical protein
VTSAAIEQLLIAVEEEQVHDLMRGMRTQARSLEDLYAGNVGAAWEVNRVDESCTHHTGGAATIR